LFSPVEAAGGICAFAYLRRGKGIPFISRPQIFSIGLYSGPSIFELSPYTDAANPIMSAEKITDVSADFVADPFVIEHNGTWFMFFEVLLRETYEGDIGLATSIDGLNWEYVGIVLDEHFHLSYPNVFKLRDEFYMIPESNRAESIRLYKAESFPSKWSFQHSLVTGRFVDPTIFYYENQWWTIRMHQLGTPCYPRRLFSSILEAFPNNSRIFLAHSGDNIVAAFFVYTFNGFVHSRWGAPLREYDSLSPNYLLNWSAIKFYCNSGMKWFDFGRSTAGSSQHTYKKRWGAQTVQLNWQYLTRPGEQLSLIKPDNSKYQRKTEIWKRLPLSLTRFLGPKVSCGLP